MADVDIFVGNNTIVDPEVYQLWLDGYTDQETATILMKRGILQKYGATFDLLLGDTQDHYRMFDMLERMLQNPPVIADQLVFQITPETQHLLIGRYYTFDACVIREILGKKMSSRNRSNLDDVCDRVKVPLRSCKRQFDNFKQVYKVVEELSGSVITNVTANFLLSPKLARQYAGIIFINHHRFETSKKRLTYLTLEDFVVPATVMMQHWTYFAKEHPGADDSDLELDKEFLTSLRDLRPLTDWKINDDHKGKTVSRVTGHLSPAASADLEGNFKGLQRIGKSMLAGGQPNFENLSKALVNIASGLNDRKELRDFFIDIVEKVIEPCKASGWSLGDIRTFLKAYQSAGEEVDMISRNALLKRVWIRFMSAVVPSVLQMYHA